MDNIKVFMFIHINIIPHILAIFRIIISIFCSYYMNTGIRFSFFKRTCTIRMQIYTFPQIACEVILAL